MSAPFDLKDHDVIVADIHRNLPPSALYENAIRYEKDASIAENGAGCLFRSQNRPLAQGQAGCKASRLRS